MLCFHQGLDVETPWNSISAHLVCLREGERQQKAPQWNVSFLKLSPTSPLYRRHLNLVNCEIIVQVQKSPDSGMQKDHTSKLYWWMTAFLSSLWSQLTISTNNTASVTKLQTAFFLSSETGEWTVRHKGRTLWMPSVGLSFGSRGWNY